MSRESAEPYGLAKYIGKLSDPSLSPNLQLFLLLQPVFLISFVITTRACYYNRVNPSPREATKTSIGLDDRKHVAGGNPFRIIATA